MKRLKSYQIQKIKRLYKSGTSLNKISKAMGIRKSIVYYHAAKVIARKMPIYKTDLRDKALLGEFLGFFIGDGSFFQDKKLGHYRISFYLAPNEPLIIERISKIVKTLFSKNLFKWYSETQHVYTVATYSKVMYLTLSRFLTWDKEKSLTIRLKEECLKNKNLTKGIIRGLINTDGHVYVKRMRVSFGSASKDLMSQCAEILKHHKVEFITYKIKKHKNHKDFYVIEIEGRRKLKVFDSKIGLIDSDKGNQIEQILSARQ